jgi:FlaA1/EpsC-like NDP-sugar epimerase
MKIKFLYKNLVMVLILDALLFTAAWYGAYLLRFNFEIPKESMFFLKRMLPFIIGIKLIVFYFFNLYKGMWRYTSIKDFFDIIKAATVSSLIIVSLILFTYRFVGIARSIFILDWGIAVFLISGYRLSIRLYFSVIFGNNHTGNTFARLFMPHKNKTDRTKDLLIIGAGDCGEKIYREIRDNARLSYNVIGFIDDNTSKVGMQIHGIPIIGTSREIKQVADKLNAKEILIAIPSATSAQMREVISRCKESGIPFKTVPGMGELIDGKVTVKAIRDVAYHDLLGREIIDLEEERISGYLEKSRVLVTGAGGSIGTELCRQICRFRPESVILFERAESSLYEIDLELRKNFPYVKVISILGDIRDRNQLSHTFSDYRPQVIFHAAAYKHVPILELQPWKAIKNNIIGTRNMILISKEYSIERFVFVSTDKAVRPANIMGASKRVAELLTQCQNGNCISNTSFITVRFGNVVGSVGSVVPLFKKQIEKGGPVTVTHPDVTRYFMTIPESCQLILQAGAMGEGCEIFFLDMGTPIKIGDMARDLIRLSGFEPDVDIKIEFIGLRPGEKLYEELITEGEGIVQTSHEKIMVLKGKTCDQTFLEGKIDELRSLAQTQDAEGIRSLLKEIIPEYKPTPHH